MVFSFLTLIIIGMLAVWLCFFKKLFFLFLNYLDILMLKIKFKKLYIYIYIYI